MKDTGNERRGVDERRAVETLFHDVLDALPVGVMVLDPEYRVVLANRKIRDLAREPDPIVQGMRCYQLSHFRSTPCADREAPCPLAAVLESREAVTVVHTHIDAEGGTHRCEVTGSPILDGSGRVTHVVEMVREIDG